ncbi:hypothetical protein BBJ28_00015625 [Nothophytophthora sp. Chile5]|nr:hypothetical protein BBJ28_00015625 [Nothophytophthora sp. Chile5]
MELHGSAVLSDEPKAEEHPEHADERDWLGEELEKALEDEDQQDGDSCERYTPQLMDTHEMRALRGALHRSEVQIRAQGRMQEYVPRKPAPLLASALRRRHGTPRYTMSAGPSPRLVASDASARNTESEGSSHMEMSPKRPMTAAAVMPTASKPKRMELKRMLGQEVRQLRGIMCC